MGWPQQVISGWMPEWPPISGGPQYTVKGYPQKVLFINLVGLLLKTPAGNSYILSSQDL